MKSYTGMLIAAAAATLFTSGVFADTAGSTQAAATNQNQSASSCAAHNKCSIKKDNEQTSNVSTDKQG